MNYRYISVFLNEADFLEKSLGLIMEVLEIILSVQRQHIYLEVIFYVHNDIVLLYLFYLKLFRIYLWEMIYGEKCRWKVLTMIF